MSETELMCHGRNKAGFQIEFLGLGSGFATNYQVTLGNSQSSQLPFSLSVSAEVGLDPGLTN